MGRHKVGQYMFVNFPEISLTEWHPFSVASAPGADFVDLYIRALGDHTREILSLAKRCNVENRSTWIRCDGPYGYLNFDYRRYGVLLMAGGGIGVTPVMSLLGDIYSENRSSEPHCIKRVCAVWVMPHTEEVGLTCDLCHHCR
jgi:respiratory burst oxidase